MSFPEVKGQILLGAVKHRVRFAILWGSQVLHAEGDFYLPTQIEPGRYLPAELLVLKEKTDADAD